MPGSFIITLFIQKVNTIILFYAFSNSVTVHSVHSNTLRDAQKSCFARFRAATLGFLFPILSGSFTGKEDPAYFFCEQKEPGTVFSISDSNSF